MMIYFNHSSLSILWSFIGIAFVRIWSLELVPYFICVSSIVSLVLMIPFLHKHELLNGNNDPFMYHFESMKLFVLASSATTTTCVKSCKSLNLSDLKFSCHQN